MVLLIVALLVVAVGVLSVGGYMAYRKVIVEGWNPLASQEESLATQGAGSDGAGRAPEGESAGASASSGSEPVAARPSDAGVSVPGAQGSQAATTRGRTGVAQPRSRPAPTAAARDAVPEEAPDSSPAGWGPNPVAPLDEAGADSGPRGWGPGPAGASEAASSANANRGLMAADARSGVILWSGPLRKNGVVTIDGNRANVGTVRGELPGVPVRVETDYKDVDLSEVPGPGNGWKRIVMRGRKNIKVVVTLRWRVME